MKQPSREEREQKNILLRAYGYHWRRTDLLTPEQLDVLCDWLFHADQRAIPPWALLSPLEVPVEEATILQWLGTQGANTEDVLTFLDLHGFVALGKDSRQHWQIQTPSGTVLNLKQSLQEIERIRVDRVNAQERKQERERREHFEQSALSLKETLSLHGRAIACASAWGYSPYPEAKRLADGTLEVMTYHFEGEWRTRTYQDEADVVTHLYTEDQLYWLPGLWKASH